MLRVGCQRQSFIFFKDFIIFFNNVYYELVSADALKDRYIKHPRSWSYLWL